VLLAERLQLVMRRDVVRADVADEARRELLLDVDPRPRALRGRRLHDAILEGVVAADVITGLIVAAFDSQVLLVRRRLPEDVVLIVVSFNGEPGFVERIEVERLLFAKLTLGEACACRVVRFADRATLREDLDDAVVGARSVEGRSGRAARDLDVLDVIRIEIGESILWIRANAEIGEV